MFFIQAAVALFVSRGAAAGIPKAIKICDMADEWPPYTYFERAGGKPTEKIIGFSIDYVTEILSKHNITATIVLIPWRRCLAEVESGVSAMLLNASVNEERKTKYLISDPYYEVTDVYFYSQAKPIKNISNTDQLKKYTLCGQAGFNYVTFGVKAEDIETTASSFEMLMTMLKGRRCDLALGRKEIAAGHRFTNGIDYTKSEEFGFGPIIGMKPAPFHMMISRKIPYANELLTLINRGITEIKKQKKDKPLKSKYGI
jgi:polar amino acid transport system substrate-binding protein